MKLRCISILLLLSYFIYKVYSKEFAQIGLSTTIGSGFSPDLWLRHRKFFLNL
jgi:hypothetical protein